MDENIESQKGEALKNACAKREAEGEKQLRDVSTKPEGAKLQSCHTGLAWGTTWLVIMKNILSL